MGVTSLKILHLCVLNQNYFYCMFIYLFSDLNVVDQVRQQIPVFGQRRTDLYDTVLKD
jgi:hypothetical protein